MISLSSLEKCPGILGRRRRRKALPGELIHGLEPMEAPGASQGHGAVPVPRAGYISLFPAPWLWNSQNSIGKAVLGNTRLGHFCDGTSPAEVENAPAHGRALGSLHPRPFLFPGAEGSPSPPCFACPAPLQHNNSRQSPAALAPLPPQDNPQLSRHPRDAVPAGFPLVPPVSR